jgi:hypothetical protein
LLAGGACTSERQHRCCSATARSLSSGRRAGVSVGPGRSRTTSLLRWRPAACAGQRTHHARAHAVAGVAGCSRGQEREHRLGGAGGVLLARGRLQVAACRGRTARWRRLARTRRQQRVQTIGLLGGACALDVLHRGRGRWRRCHR